MSRRRNSSLELKKRLYCCSMCDFYSAKQSVLNKHFHKTHGIEHVTPDMIKTKVSAKMTPNGTHTTKPDPGLPTTGRPVLMTPSGPISMRNMRREPTQAELVSLLLEFTI